MTGILVPYDPDDAAGFERGLADGVNAVIADPAKAAAMGRAGRERAATEFSWDSVAEQTLAVYAAAGA